MTSNAGASREAFHEWVEDGLSEAATGTRTPFAILDAGSGAAIGSSSYLTLRRAHRGLPYARPRR